MWTCPRVKRLMSEYGLVVPTLGTGMAASDDGLVFSHPDVSVRALAVKRVRGHIAFASETGAAITIGVMSGKLATRDPEERRRRRMQALACLAEVCRMARRAGVTVLLEPLNRYECDYINTLADGVGGGRRDRGAQPEAAGRHLSHEHRRGEPGGEPA